VQAGLVWRPTEQLQFRGGYAVSYKAPQLRQIGGGIQGTSQQAGLVDPLRGNEAVNGNVLVTYGANSALQPETGKSHALSIVYASERVAGLRAELTEFAIEMNNYIASPPLQTLLDHPDVFVGAIVRAPPSAQDIQQGLPGPITAINDLYYNYGALRVSGVNLDLSCRTTSLLRRLDAIDRAVQYLQMAQRLEPRVAAGELSQSGDFLRSWLAPSRWLPGERWPGAPTWRKPGPEKVA